MRKPDLIHPDLLTSLDDFYSSLCTVQNYTSALDDYKDDVKTWADLAGHVDIPCSIAAAGKPEVKRADMTFVPATHTVSLAGYYPLITEKMRAVIGSLTLDILLVEFDSHQKTTRLSCEVVR